MAKLLVSLDLIAEALFEGHVEVKGIETWDTLNSMTAAVEIEGPSVPDCEWVSVLIGRKFFFEEMAPPPEKCLARRVKHD